MVFSTAYPRIHFTVHLEVYLGRGGIFDCVSAYPLHNILLRSLLGEGWYFRLRIRVSTSQYTWKFTWGGVVFSTAYPRIHFTIYLEVYLGRSGIFDCVSAYPLHNILRSFLGEGWYFRLRIRVSAYPLHNILRSLLGEEWYFRLRIRVSSLFRGAASKWQGILQLLLGRFHTTSRDTNNSGEMYDFWWTNKRSYTVPRALLLSWINMAAMTSREQDPLAEKP